MIYIKPVIIFLTFAICFSSELISHRLGRVGARKARSKRGVKYVLPRYRGRGANRGKLVFVVERESK